MTLERWLVLAGFLLWALSLLMPALIGDAFPAQRGSDLLRQGAGLWRQGVVAWYANPALLIALILVWFGKFRLGIGMGLLCAVLALTTFLAPAALERAGSTVPEFRYGLGFYLWLTAIPCAILAALAGIRRAAHS